MDLALLRPYYHSFVVVRTSTYDARTGGSRLGESSSVFEAEVASTATLGCCLGFLVYMTKTPHSGIESSYFVYTTAGTDSSPGPSSFGAALGPAKRARVATEI